MKEAVTAYVEIRDGKTYFHVEGNLETLRLLRPHQSDGLRIVSSGCTATSPDGWQMYEPIGTVKESEKLKWAKNQEKQAWAAYQALRKDHKKIVKMLGGRWKED